VDIEGGILVKAFTRFTNIARFCFGSRPEPPTEDDNKSRRPRPHPKQNLAMFVNLVKAFTRMPPSISTNLMPLHITP